MLGGLARQAFPRCSSKLACAFRSSHFAARRQPHYRPIRKPAAAPRELSRRTARDECVKEAVVDEGPQSATRAHDDEVESLVGAYSEYWNHIRFRKGWAEPRFHPSEGVHQLLREAASLVAAIQSQLDDGGPVFRQRGGNAVNHLLSVDYHPEDHPQRFVRELVHASLQDAKGYLYNLSAAAVDDLLHQHTGGPPPLSAPPQPAQQDAADTDDAIDINVKEYEQQVDDIVKAASIDWSKVKQRDPREFSKQVELLQERCQESSSRLMKDLLSLEHQVRHAIQKKDRSVPMHLAYRQKQCIHQLLAIVNEVTGRLQVLRDMQEKEEARVEEEAWTSLVQKVEGMMKAGEVWKEMTCHVESNEERLPGRYLLTLYAPDLSLPDTEVNVSGNMLTVSGMCLPSDSALAETLEGLKNSETRGNLISDGPDVVLKAMVRGRWGRFRKSYNLPAPVDPKTVRANYSKGVLSVSLPDASGTYFL